MKFLRGVTLLLTLLLAACGSDGANLQFFNASPDGPSLDVEINGELIVIGVEAESFFQYREVNAGSALIRLNEEATSRTLAQTEGNLIKNQDYTLIALGSAASMEALLLADDNSTDQASTAKIRLVHASPSSGALDFYLTAPGTDISGVNPLVSNLAFGDVSEYLTVGADTYQVRATLAGTKTLAIDSGNFVLGQSQVRTGIAVDKLGGGLPPGIVFLPDRL